MAMFQLPSLDKLAAGLSEFPPKISSLAELLTEPERMFEQTVASLGLPTLPGPATMVSQMLQGIESMAPKLSLPAGPSLQVGPVTLPAPSVSFSPEQERAQVRTAAKVVKEEEELPKGL